MKLGSSFHVPADPRTVFETFLDAPTMRTCVPGCVELERPEETRFHGRLRNEIAHVRFEAAFAVEITEIAPPHTVRAVLTAEDARLASSLRINAALDVAAVGDGSDVTYAMEMTMWGRLGRMGEAILRRRTAEVEEQFVAAFAGACTGHRPDVSSADMTRAPAGAHTVPDRASVPLVPLDTVSGPARSALPGVPGPSPASTAVVRATHGTEVGPAAPPTPWSSRAIPLVAGALLAGLGVGFATGLAVEARRSGS